jgi:hypothetical protein
LSTNDFDGIYGFAITPVWLLMDFPVAVGIMSYQLAISVVGEAPKTWQLQGSLDGSAWENVGAAVTFTQWNTSVLYSFTPSVTPPVFRYWRLNIVQINSTQYYSVDVTELIFHTVRLEPDPEPEPMQSLNYINITGAVPWGPLENASQPGMNDLIYNDGGAAPQSWQAISM